MQIAGAPRRMELWGGGEGIGGGEERTPGRCVGATSAFRKMKRKKPPEQKANR